jgi:hypothetical protein
LFFEFKNMSNLDIAKSMPKEIKDKRVKIKDER